MSDLRTVPIFVSPPGTITLVAADGDALAVLPVSREFFVDQGSEVVLELLDEAMGRSRARLTGCDET